jgi:hypothetical protein
MLRSRRRGYGGVSSYLKSVGVPRANAYRWEAQLHGLVELGSAGLRALRRERTALLAEVARLRAGGGRRAGLGPQAEWEFIVAAAVLGTSDEEIATLLRRAGGRSLSHQTVHATLAAAAGMGRVVYERHFAGVGRVVAADEIFLGSEPLLLMVGPLSLLISGLRLAERRGSEDWRPVFAGQRELVRCSGDEGRGLVKARKDAGVALQGDEFHLLGAGRVYLAALARGCEAAARDQQEAEREVERARFCGGKHRGLSATSRLGQARSKADRLLAEYCRLDDLLGEIRRAFAYTAAEGRLATAGEARARVARALAAMRQSRDGERLAKKLRVLERPWAFAYLDVVEEGVRGLRLEQVGPNRSVRLGRRVADTLAWRRTDKTPVAWLARASTGSLADEVELAVLGVLDEAIRSSSYVECVNSRVRLVQVARKRMSEDFVCLLAVHHNMKSFGRGSVREGWTPAELAGIQLPTHDWLELLRMTASELGKPLVRAAAPAA